MFISAALMLQRHLTALIIFLFSCLIDRDVSWCIVNTLHAWFRHMKACVKWENDLSAYFSINSGVPERSLLGPRLYNIVMDKL